MFGATGYGEQQPRRGTWTEAAAASTPTQPLRLSFGYGSPRPLSDLIDSARHGLIG